MDDDWAELVRDFDSVFDRLKQATKEMELWMHSLTDLEKQNFHALTALPNAREVIEDCADGEIRKWGLFVIAFSKERN